MLSFGVTVLPDPPASRMIELMQVAEQHGFEYAWTYDSHILWQDSYATLALVADKTERIKLGHFVTNPGIRAVSSFSSSSLGFRITLAASGSLNIIFAIRPRSFPPRR